MNINMRIFIKNLWNKIQFSSCKGIFDHVFIIPYDTNELRKNIVGESVESEMMVNKFIFIKFEIN